MGQTKNKLLDREFTEAFNDPNVAQFFREKDAESEEQMTEETNPLV